MVGLDQEDCLATLAMSRDPEDRLEDFEDQDWDVWNPTSTIMVASGKPVDDRPCQLCKGTDHQEDMILCDRCNAWYHRDCARKTKGSRIHKGPWFCATCKGTLTLEGYPDITQDWPLMDHLWTGWLPQDPTETDRI